MSGYTNPDNAALYQSIREPTEADVHQAATQEYEPDTDPFIIAGRAERAKDRRDRIAEGFAFSMVSGRVPATMVHPDQYDIARASVILADALIQELDRT